MAENNNKYLQSFQGVIKSCIWCKKHSLLKHGKQYCLHCETNMYKECSKCHLPYSNAKYFTNAINKHQCNSCHRKYTEAIENKKKSKIELLARNQSSNISSPAENIAVVATAFQNNPAQTLWYKNGRSLNFNGFSVLTTEESVILF